MEFQTTDEVGNVLNLHELGVEGAGEVGVVVVRGTAAQVVGVWRYELAIVVALFAHQPPVLGVLDEARDKFEHRLRPEVRHEVVGRLLLARHQLDHAAPLRLGRRADDVLVAVVQVDLGKRDVNGYEAPVTQPTTATARHLPPMRASHALTARGSRRRSSRRSTWPAARSRRYRRGTPRWWAARRRWPWLLHLEFLYGWHCSSGYRWHDFNWDCGLSLEFPYSLHRQHFHALASTFLREDMINASNTDKTSDVASDQATLELKAVSRVFGDEWELEEIIKDFSFPAFAIISASFS